MKKLAIFLTFAVIVSCTNENIGTYKTKSVISDVSVEPSLPPDENFKPPLPDSHIKSDNIKINQRDIKEDKPNFDFTPPDDTISADDEITVIYKNSYKVRLDKSSNKVSSTFLDVSNKINSILLENKLIKSSDMRDESLSDDEMDKIQEKISTEREIDIPHLKSIHYYRFDKSRDIKKLCKELRKLPFVRLAYPTPKTFPTSVRTTIGITNNNESNPSPPSDPSFGFPESTHWYWFNKHKVFKGWGVYGSTIMPNIAVIDYGFNVNSNEINVGNVYYLDQFGTSYGTIFGNCPNKICAQELPSDDHNSTYSHGSMVASVAGGKKNNAIGLCGIAPGATMTLLKVNDYASNIPTAIAFAADDPSVDVINISQAIKMGGTGLQYPLCNVSDVNTKITYSVFTKNKPVVITSGNNEIDPYTDYRIQPPISIVQTDGIIVGGSEPSSTTGKQKAWTTDDPNTSTLLGANYNSGSENTISLTASAYNISFVAYNKVQSTDSFTNSSGTSMSAPMVSATLGMMKRLNPNLSASKLKDILIYSSNIYKYDDGYNGSSNKFMGKNLNDNNYNNGSIAGIRDLNTYNALTIAKNISNYQVITRSHNIDDYVASINDSNPSTFPYPGGTLDGYGNDIIYGYNSVTNPSSFNFSEYNSSGGCTYGYQLYTNKFYYYSNMFSDAGGVSGVATVPNCNSNSWNFTKYYTGNGIW